MSELEKAEQDLDQLEKDLLPSGKYWGAPISTVVVIVCNLSLRIARLQIEQMKRSELWLSRNFIEEYRHGSLGAEMRRDIIAEIDSNDRKD